MVEPAHRERGIAHLVFLVIIGIVALVALFIIFKVISGKQFGSSAQQMQASSGFYSNFDDGLSIQAPKNWQLKDDSNPQTQAAFFAQKENRDDKFVENVSLYISDVSAKPDVTVEETVTAWIDQSKLDYPDSFELVSQENATLGGISAVKVVATAKDDISPLKSMIVFALKDGKSYILAYSAEEKSFDKFLPDVENLINSFKFGGQEVKWKTYTSDEYGYTVMVPADWKVTDTPSKTSRETSITHPQGKALVLITALKDDNLKDITYMKDSIAQFKEKLENDSATLKLDTFNEQTDGNIRAFIATGLERRGGADWVFEQRGMLSTNGRVLLFHGAAQSAVSTAYTDVVSEIIEIFKME